MPRYRIVKPLPAVLLYRNGARVHLEEFTNTRSQRTLAARKLLPNQAVIVLAQDINGFPLSVQLERGFDVDPATVDGAAADRIMQTLLARGYAKLVVE